MNKCPACFSRRVSVKISKPLDYEYFVVRNTSAKLLKCDECESIFQVPWPSVQEANDFYPPDYQNYSKTSIPLLKFILDFFHSRVAKKFIEQNGKNCRVLDFGCGDGLFLEQLKKEGVSDLVGFEPLAESSQSGDRQTIKMIKYINDLTQCEQFDVIRMNHVIEHLSDLDKTMDLLVGILKPDGKFIIQTPNSSSMTFKIFRRYWGALHYPYHTIIFSPQGMKSASQRWGLRLDDIQHTSMPTGWSMSIENLLKEFLSIRQRGRLAVYSVFIFMAMPFVYIEALFSPQKSTILDYVMKKNDS